MFCICLFYSACVNLILFKKSVFLGVTLYELHAPIMILTTRQFERQQISKTELRHRLKEVVTYLEEANIILGFEPETSPEGMMGIAAKSALLKVKDWGKIVGKM